MSSVPYDFYPAVLYALGEFSKGRSLTVSCDMANISIPTFETYVRNDDALQRLYVEAERRGHDAMADALLTPGRKGSLIEDTNPQMAKVVSDNIKWLLSKRDQKRFGEKIEIKHEITLDRAITDAMDAARKRVHERRAIELTAEEQEALPPPPSFDPGDIIDVLTEDDELLSELLA